jgi:hypothetical protein
MPVRTSIALAAAFLGLTAVAEAESGGSRMESSDRQSEGFSSGPQGQYFGSTAPRAGYYYGHYDYSPSGSVHRNHRKGVVPPTNNGQHPPSRP